MPWIIILLLIALGIIFLLLELLVVPGTTFIGIIGFISLALGVYQTFVIYGISWGVFALIATSIVSVLMLILSLRSKTWKKAMLSTSIKSKVNQDSKKISIGDEGITISRLTPMGKARFGNNFIEVSTFGDFLDPEMSIRIIEIKNNKIFVEPIEEG
ncbi:MAG: NfeD family protein [Bacteroidales bacterium]|nr:NfeD family protein [Bacteroidales bacterium]